MSVEPYPFKAAMAVAVGASKPQRPGYGPGHVPPPYPGAPPIPAGVAVNPQQWQNGWWQYNPAYRPTATRSTSTSQPHVPWIPAQAWQHHIQQQPPPSSSSASSASASTSGASASTSASSASSVTSYGPSPPPFQNSSTQNSASAAAAAHAAANQQVRATHAAQAAQAAASYNPYKRVIPAPSAEYLSQPLIANPLGLWEVSKGEKPNMTVATPWIWNPAKLHADKDDDDTDEDDDGREGEQDVEEDDDMSSTAGSSTTVVGSPDPMHKDFTSKSALRPTFSPSIVRTPSYYQHHPGVNPAANPYPGPNPSPHPTTNPHPNPNPLQRTATMPVLPLPLGSLGNSSMHSLSSTTSASSSFSSFSSMGSLSSSSSYTANPSPTSARGFASNPYGANNKPSPPRFLDGLDHLSEEPDSILSPLPLFDSAPLPSLSSNPSFSNPFPTSADPHSSRDIRDRNIDRERERDAPREVRDWDRQRKPPRPSGLGRASYTPPDPIDPSYRDPASHPSSHLAYRAESYDEHDALHDDDHPHDYAPMGASGGGGGGSVRRREREREEKEREKRDEKDRERRAKREADRRLKTGREADRALKSHMHSSHSVPPLLVSAPHDDPRTPPQPQLGVGAETSRETSRGTTPTPTPSQQQAAQYAQARAQQERRQQEYYRALERQRSGDAGGAGGEQVGASERAGERERTGSGSNPLRAAPTLDAHAFSEPSVRLPDSAMGLGGSASRQGSGSGERQGSEQRQGSGSGGNGGEGTHSWASWRGEQRGPPPASITSSSSSSSASSTGTVTAATAGTGAVQGTSTAPKPFPPPQPLPRRESAMSASMPSIPHSSSTPARIVDRRDSARDLHILNNKDAVAAHKLGLAQGHGLGSRFTVAAYAPSPAPHMRQESPTTHRGTGSRENSHESVGAGGTPQRRDSHRDAGTGREQRKDSNDTPGRKRSGAVPAPLNNLPQPWQETPVRTPDRGSAGAGRSRGASFASASASPPPTEGAYPYGGGGSGRRDSGRDREREVNRTQSMSNVDSGSSNTTTPTPSRFMSSHNTSHHSGTPQRERGSAAAGNPLPPPPMPSPLAESITSLSSLQRFAEILSPPGTPSNAHALPSHRRRTRSPSHSRSRSRSRDVVDRMRRANIASPRTPPANGHHPNAYFSPSGPQPHPPIIPSSRSSTPRTSSSTSTTTPPTAAPLAPATTGPQPRRPASSSSNKLRSTALHHHPSSQSPSSSIVSLSVGSGPWRRRVGYWNRRGDHLTADGYLVFAPPDRAYPPDLRTYPLETEGYQDEFGNFSSWAHRPELPASLPRHGKEPEKPYDQFVIYCSVHSEAAANS